jgi:hypothetical protein
MLNPSFLINFLADVSLKLQVPEAGHTGSPFDAMNPLGVNVIFKPTKKVLSETPSMVSEFITHGEATISFVAFCTGVSGVEELQFCRMQKPDNRK